MEALKELEEGEVIRIWNEYCIAVRNYDGEIMDAYEMEEWANNSGDTIGILNRFFFGSDDMNASEYASANPNRNYFTFNGYGNIVSFDYIYNEFSDEFYHVDAEDLAEYIVENEDCFCNSDLLGILGDEEE